MRLTEEELKMVIKEAVEAVLFEEKKTKKRKYKGKTYKASKGSVEAIKKAGGSVEKALKTGAFDWATTPAAAAKAAQIVATGHAED